jgi:membrane protein
VWVIDGMGLSGSSADAVALVFSAPGRVLGTTSVFGVLLVGVFGVSFAGAVQAGFERIWGVPAGAWHKVWRQVVWLAVLTAYIFAEATVGTVTHGGLAATGAVAVLPGIVFFWWGLRFLLGGRVSYLAAMPGAVATIVGLGGLRVFSGLVFEPLVASNAVSYGALGTVLIMQSWLRCGQRGRLQRSEQGRYFQPACLYWCERGSGRRGRRFRSGHPNSRPGPHRWLRCRRSGLMLISKEPGKSANGAWLAAEQPTERRIKCLPSSCSW